MVLDISLEILEILFFKTKREATEALKRTEKIAQKRLLLKAYEVELNKQLDLQEHYIIK